jgi:Ni/Fe-hydrogenase subunit HybB-like protein
MFEVAWCVMLYTTVLALEFAPVVFERLNMPRPRRILRAITIPLIIAGITLSTLHQSSLGSLFLIFPEKLSALWYSPLLPLLFFTSAVAVGLAMVTVESLLSARFLGRDAHMDLMSTVAKATATVLLIYAALKIADVTARSAWSALTPFDWSDMAWLLEMGLVVLLPAALLLIPSVRASPGKLLAVQLLVVIGVVANRVTLAVPSLVAANGGSYFPAPMEFAVSVALVTAGVLAFALAAKHLPVFAVHKEAPHR